MPEMPEVEILARHLRPLLRGKTIRSVSVRRERATRPTPPREFKRALAGSKIKELNRRGKYLLFQLEPGPNDRKHLPKQKSDSGFVTVLGHLGMSGRMFVALKNEELPRHTAVIFDLGDRNFIYEDRRYFGRMSLDLSPLDELGPEPLDFSPESFATALKQSRQPIKVKLLDQSLIVGVGNIYASEALFRARISPKLAANRLSRAQAKSLLRAIREVLDHAVKFGSTVPLKTVSGKSDALFYFDDGGEGYYEKRLRVYDRAGKPCVNKCGAEIARITQGARSTYYCPHCQRTR
ncbi:MAG TPA: bifunctional DNA-formamidopyrimidine glycosylase/DNA-(apurinic or apyrimidinic site) lyase, partial [Candidatus Acidoferrales bacterium]|jgi:formamidopyrimidine-DNA glycosylase|nr:bifunctional DNA-formamidopyrimidine glycosylase/DNA-(apurinic or apyrimidinic site) lyase [Candidatus Acidoferrales bacterium]